MNYYPSLRILAAALMMVALGMTAAPIPAGLSKIEVGTGTNTLTLFTYKPHNYNNGPLVMVFHGALRNAETYCSNSIPLAERYQALIIAPLFDTNRFPQGEYGTGCVLKRASSSPAAIGPSPASPKSSRRCARRSRARTCPTISSVIPAADSSPCA